MTSTYDLLGTLLSLLEPGHSASDRFSIIRQLSTEHGEALLSEADRQGVASILYPTLVELEKIYSWDSPLKENLYQSYINSAVRNTIFLEDARVLLQALQHAGISAAGLKGIYLLENIYGDIGSRSMGDIDILVKKQDLGDCLEVMKGMGYTPTTYFSLGDQNIDTKHVPPMKKKSGPMVEVHWTLLEEDEPFTIDASALWERMIPAKIANCEVLALGLEDLILHLCLHLTYQHYLRLGLRGFLDIALVVHKFRAEIDWQKLIHIAKSWGSERVTALTLKLVETELKVPIPAEVFSALLPEGLDPGLLGQARRQLLERVRFDDHFTPDLVEFSGQNNLRSKIKIGLKRVFIPRLALARTYNVPPNSPKILGFYWVRLKYLIRNYGKTVLRLERGEKGTEPARQKAEISNTLHEWMSYRTGLK